MGKPGAPLATGRYTTHQELVQKVKWLYDMNTKISHIARETFVSETTVRTILNGGRVKTK